VIRKLTIAASLALGGLTSVGCVGVGPLDPGGVEVQISPSSLLLTAIGARTRLEFTLGDGVPAANVVWRSSAPSVATVDSNGTVTAVADGTTTITAETGGMSASTTVTVSATIVNVVQVHAQQGETNTANNVSTVSVTVTAN
jgi:uncharacterized protein YjdB